MEIVIKVIIQPLKIIIIVFYYFDQYQANNDDIPNLAFSCDLINTNSKV